MPPESLLAEHWKAALALLLEAYDCAIDASSQPWQFATALAGESADALYHLAVLWAAAGITPADVYAKLQAREGQSGLAEKAARKS